jgi:hypothetical protein
MYEQFREISNESREVFDLPVDGLVYFELIIPNNAEFNNNSFEVHIE